MLIFSIYLGTVLLCYPFAYTFCLQQDDAYKQINERVIAIILSIVPFYNIFAVLPEIKKWLILKSTIRTIRKTLKNQPDSPERDQVIMTMNSLEEFNKLRI